MDLHTRENMAAEAKDKFKQSSQIQKQIEKLQHKSDVINAEIKLLMDKQVKLHEEYSKILRDMGAR